MGNKEDSEQEFYVKGKLERLIHTYENGKFRNSFIRIEPEGEVKGYNQATFYGMIPETLLGKNIILKAEYNKETKELRQQISEESDESGYFISSYVKNFSGNEDEILDSGVFHDDTMLMWLSKEPRFSKKD
ncbi:MAG: hypothetical protein AABY32_03635 [Nanoarchaeota archaeon]